MTHDATLNVLRVDASARRDGSISRRLADRFVNRLDARLAVRVTERDLAHGLDFVTEDWIGANFTDPSQRTAAQREALAVSDALVAELKAADVIAIGVPIYNFGVPAAFKAWIDMVARARETFRYTESGPVGLLDGKKAVIFVASGGVELDTVVDFATPYIRHVLGFLGITDVTVVGADQLMVRDADAVAAAEARAESAADAVVGALRQDAQVA